VLCFSGFPVVSNLRTRLLSLRLLEILLPANGVIESDDREHFVQRVFNELSLAMWTSPTFEAIHAVAQQKRQLESVIVRMSKEDSCVDVMTGTPASPSASEKSASGSGFSSPLIDVKFDADRMLNCTIDTGVTLIHGAGGRGYGLTSMPIVSGCYQWKVDLVINDS